MTHMLDSDWFQTILLRSDWLPPEVALLTTHIASNLYIKMTTTGWPLSCNTRIKVTSAVLTCPTNRVGPAHVIRTLLSVVLSRSLHDKALEFAVFEREYD